MPSEDYLDEAVLFELPTIRFGEQLLDELGSERFAWRQPVYGASVVGVLLTSDQLDLALLLRRVQAWVEQVGLIAIRFEVDGRIYLLEAKQAIDRALCEDADRDSLTRDQG